MTRGRKGPRGEEGYAKAPVIVEDELQDQKVVKAVREVRFCDGKMQNDKGHDAAMARCNMRKFVIP